jgi:hypothetical protein
MKAMTNDAVTPDAVVGAEDTAIDRTSAERFLRRLDGKARTWTFQTFDDDRTRRDRSLVRVFHGALGTHFEELARLNRNGAGVFVTVNQTDGRGRTKENIVRIRAVWQEDDGEGRPLPLEPQLVVETSAGKHHRYLLAEGLTPAEHRSLQDVLVARYGSDPNATDLTRVLRLPGFFHNKGAPFRVRITRLSDAPPYPRDTLYDAFPSTRPIQDGRPAEPAGEPLIEAGHRNRVLTSLAGSMRRRGMSEAAIAAALTVENQTRCCPPLPHDEALGIARSIARYPAGEPGAPTSSETNEPTPRESVADALINLVGERAELFHDADHRVYATIQENGHQETWALDSRTFSTWLSATYFRETGKAPREMALKDALHTLAGIGRFAGERRKVWLRVGVDADGYVLDLANDRWQAVEVTAAGWQVRDDVSVRFWRTTAMRPLPVPVRGGDVEALWQVTNIAEADRPLVLAWILECLRPETHTPVLELGGEQGSGKSETQARLRALVDPSEISLRAAPTRLEDLFISAHNNWLVSLNNLSRLSRAQQDALCVLSTGGGFATRTLYSNAEETAFNAQRPVVMNGIAGLATAQDLIDRLIRIELPVLERRRASAELTRAFEDERPRLLGALLDLFAATLRELPNIQLEDPPRMADFAQLGEAMFRALGRSDGFVDLYRARQQATSLTALESSPVACAVLSLMETTDHWSGPTKALLVTLGRHRQDTEAWPRSPRGLGDALRRNISALRLLGIEVRFDPTRRRDGHHVALCRFDDAMAAGG